MQALALRVGGQMCTRTKAHHCIEQAPAWGTRGLLGVRKDCVQWEGPRCRPCALTPFPAPHSAERDLPPTDIHHPGGDGGDGACQ